MLTKINLNETIFNLINPKNTVLFIKIKQNAFYVALSLL